MTQTIDYVKNNMEITELLGSLGWNALKALLTTIPIIGAILLAFRVFPFLPLFWRAVVGGFVAISLVAMFMILKREIGFSDLNEWVFTKKIDREQMALMTVISWVIAVVVLIVLVVLRDLILTLLYLTPLSALPTLAFLYMFRFKYESRGQRVLWSLIYGYGFGAGLKATGLLLVLLVDVIGWQLTVLGVACEILISAFYLYIDLTEWVKQDLESKMSAEQRQAAREELALMSEIAGRIRQ